MTREDAIKNIKEHCYFANLIPTAKEALDMAIKALEQEPCEDVVDRQAVNELVDELARAISDERSCISRGRSTATIMRDILHLPSITPHPKVGQWIYTGDYITDGMLKCSECGFEHDVSERFSYCPMCGAKMSEIPTGAEWRDKE